VTWRDRIDKYVPHGARFRLATQALTLAFGSSQARP